MLALTWHSGDATQDWQSAASACRQIVNDGQRLACYDDISDVTAAPATEEYLIPDRQFMQAELRTVPDQRDYTLTVEKFLVMLREARYDDTKSVVIHGWTRQADNYLLHITLREPVVLEFFYHHSDGQNYCVLQPVVAGKRVYNPEQFIFILAAMTMRP